MYMLESVTHGPLEHAAEVDRAVGARIREVRALSGVTLCALAERIGVTYQQLQKYETGKNRVSAGQLALIAQMLGKNPSYFFEESEDEDDSARTLYRRMSLELLKNFRRIKTESHRQAVHHLARLLAQE
jgi:transcriptional regulator with XRE-family HTH domain